MHFCIKKYIQNTLPYSKWGALMHLGHPTKRNNATLFFKSKYFMCIFNSQLHLYLIQAHTIGYLLLHTTAKEFAVFPYFLKSERRPPIWTGLS